MESTERYMGGRFERLWKWWVSGGHGGTVQERFIYFGAWQKEKEEEIRRIERVFLVLVGYKGRVQQRWDGLNVSMQQH